MHVFYGVNIAHMERNFDDAIWYNCYWELNYWITCKLKCLLWSSILLEFHLLRPFPFWSPSFQALLHSQNPVNIELMQIRINLQVFLWYSSHHWILYRTLRERTCNIELRQITLLHLIYFGEGDAFKTYKW